MDPESALPQSAEGALRPYLEHFAEMGGPMQRVPLLALPFVLGRSETAGHTIYSSKVSKEHAAIVLIAGRYAVRDLQSTNGTFVNGERIDERVLQDGDIIHVAHVEFRFRHQQLVSGIVGPRVTRPVEQTQVVEADQPDSLIRGAQLLDELIATQAVAVLYQPIVDLQTREIAGYEALGRGTHAELPGDPEPLLRLASQCGKLMAVSQLLRRCALASSARLPIGARLFLNVHAAELAEPAFVESLAALVQSDVTKRRIVMEIAESSVTDVVAMGEARHALRGLDMELAYDDFGAGQARLNELIEIPPDYLKLDKTLVQGLDVSSARREMVGALVNIARGLGVRTIAEGIETDAVAEACRELRCELGQGYFFGVPV